MVLHASEMHVDRFGDAELFDRLMLQRFPPGGEGGQQSASEREQNENSGGPAQNRHRKSFFAWIRHVLRTEFSHRGCVNLVIQYGRIVGRKRTIQSDPAFGIR
jgi:hypothetical protein